MKLTMKVRLVGADGDVYEEEGDEEGEAAASGRAAADPSQAEWAAMHAKLEADVLAFLSRGVGDVSQVRASWAMTTEAAGQGDFAGAVTMGGRLTQLLTAGASPAKPASAVPPAPPPPAPAPAQPDAAALTRLLMALEPRIPAAAGENAERKAVLMKLATQAQVYLKTNNPRYAADTIEQLRSETKGGSPTPPPPPADMDAQLTRVVAALVPRIAQVAGADVALRTSLVGLAQEAGGRRQAAR